MYFVSRLARYTESDGREKIKHSTAGDAASKIRVSEIVCLLHRNNLGRPMVPSIE